MSHCVERKASGAERQSYIEPVDERQEAILRRMTGQQRLRIGFEITEFALNLARAGIRRQYPGISDEGVREKLSERLYA